MSTRFKYYSNWPKDEKFKDFWIIWWDFVMFRDYYRTDEILSARRIQYWCQLSRYSNWLIDLMLKMLNKAKMY
jgi:hypothetical protein